jgi:hypothetical protein
MSLVSQGTATAIRFTATLSSIDSSTIVRLPKDASARLPSRGQVAVRGSINGHDFQTVLEPDGLRGHWLRVDRELQQGADVDVGDTVSVVLAPIPEWPEPEVPADLAAALAGAPQKIREMWDDITPMARWEWVRWVNATANSATRDRRVEVSISKMSSGKRRPCCFDLSACTDPAVSKNGKLRDES